MSKVNLNEFEGHSPGPWWVDEWEDGDGESMPERYWSVEQDVIQVCLVYNEKDARLIAAVPDLLAEVERLRDRLDLAESYIIEPTLKRNYFADVVNKSLDDESDNLG